MITLNYPVSAVYISKISQHFGEHPEWYAPFGMPGHGGLDWAIINYSDIFSAAPGTVSLIETDKPGYGLNIRITHWGTEGEEYTTIYGHLGNVKVVLHQTVEAGQLIALSDNTGNSTGPHLHFGLRDKSKAGEPYKGWVDPMPFFRAIPAPTPPADVPKLGKVIADILNVRSGPSVNDTIIGNIGKTLVVQIYDQTTDASGNLWYKVKYGTKIGWACAVYKQVYIQPIISGTHQ